MDENLDISVTWSYSRWVNAKSIYNEKSTSTNGTSRGCWTYDDAENEEYDSDMHVHYLRKLALAPLEYNKLKILERGIKVNGKDASC